MRAYRLTEDGTITTTLSGRELLAEPMLNKGVAFTPEERRELKLEGLLPPTVLTIGEQVRRVYEQFRKQPDDLHKNIALNDLMNRNTVLFYRLLSEHLSEMLPIVYTPTVGRAIQEYSHAYRKPGGVYLSIDDVEGMERAFRNLNLEPGDIDLIVATDSESILGIGDWGVGGINIAIGKLAVYTAAAGIDPSRVLAVVLDVGTDNDNLLNDPLYMGCRHERVRGEAYDAFIDAYVRTSQELFPGSLLHWEDFGNVNARKIIEKYGYDVPSFNDDIQGTGAVTLAAVLSGAKLSGVPLCEHRILVFGPGAAGIGNADQIAAAMERAGLSEEEARARFWAYDSRGLLTDETEGVLDFQRPYVRRAAECTDWERESEDDTCRSDEKSEVERMDNEHARAQSQEDETEQDDSEVGADAASRAGRASEARTEARIGNVEAGSGAFDRISLLEVVRRVKPTILIGTSGVPGAFAEEVVREMARHAERPIIMPMSNPTQLAEAVPADLLRWTEGRALIATGSPFAPVEYGGIVYEIGQSNNALVFPGLGLGAIVTRSARITERMFAAAADAVAALADLSRPGAALLPGVRDLRRVSEEVAVAVAEAAMDDGAARAYPEEVRAAVRGAMWDCSYKPVRAETREEARV